MRSTCWISCASQTHSDDITGSIEEQMAVPPLFSQDEMQLLALSRGQVKHGRSDGSGVPLEETEANPEIDDQNEIMLMPSTVDPCSFITFRGCIA